jgi:hypothetical protein
VQTALRVIKFSAPGCENSFGQNIKAMKNSRTKKLSKKVSTVSDFNRGSFNGLSDSRPTMETDPTTVTVTLITTTANTYKPAKC